jgi:hypothetical protein
LVPLSIFTPPPQLASADGRAGSIF